MNGQRRSETLESVLNKEKILKTRMHYSRMRTACLLTVSRSIPCISGMGLLNPSPGGRLPPPDADPPGGRPPPPEAEADPPWIQTTLVM